MVLPTDEQLRAMARELEDLARERLVRKSEHERRSVERVPFYQVMRLATGRDAKAFTDWSWRVMLSLDVSRRGLGLVSPADSLQVEGSVVVNCLPGQAEQLFIPGRVVRVDETVPGLCMLGIEFEFRSDLLDGVEVTRAVVPESV